MLNHDDEVLSRLKVYEAPPDGFDPHSASDKLLRKHGFPRRPDPEKEPQLSKLWRDAFSRPVKVIKPQLAVDRVMSQRRPLLNMNAPEKNTLNKHAQSKKSDFGPSGWGGVIVQTSSLGYNPFEPANVVYAQLVVPTMESFPNELNQPLTVGFWVGLGGAFGSQELLQAGIAATVNGNNTSYWAWFEWYTTQYQDPAVAITNFPISPGDLITVLVCTPQPDHGFVSMLNVKTNVTTSVGVPARPGITSDGTTAEWIVEGVSPQLPDFVDVVFVNITAGTQHHSFDLTDGTLTSISGTNGNLTTASIMSPKAAGVIWDGSN